MNKESMKLKFKQYLFVAVGVILLDVAFYFFLDPADLVFGGMMGLAILFEPLFSTIGTWFTASIFLFIANTLALFIGRILLGKDFFFKTIFSSLFSPLVVFVFEGTCDPMFFLKEVSATGFWIVSIICGILFSGLGLGIALKNNGSTGGMDVVQKILSKYLHVPYSKTMYLTDFVIVLFAGFHFQSPFSYNIEMVIYGSFGVFGTAVIVDMIVLNAKGRRTVYIITTKPIEVRDFIYREIDRGVTFVNVEGAYTNESKTMVFCTMEKNEAYRITQLVKQTDPLAFCFVSETREIVGEYLNNTKRIL